jgi:hypothetical protein
MISFIFRVEVKGIGREGMDWGHLAEDRVQWWAYANTVMKLRSA